MGSELTYLAFLRQATTSGGSSLDSEGAFVLEFGIAVMFAMVVVLVWW